MPSSGVQTCALDRKSTRLNSSHLVISYAVFCLKKNNYSVPYNLVHEQVEIRSTPTTVEIFHMGKRVGSHLRSRGNGQMFFFLMKRRPRKPTLFPYTPPFR